MTDGSPSDSHSGSGSGGPRRRPPRRIPIPWWGLTALGAGVGWLVASWPGLVFGGGLGFFAWKLR
ncbi:MAG: hypothetical protein HKO98_08105 [Gemmatimonadetes bacterium]|nr:hypothetical protein [Gemmatimonadota bacterium]NNK63164.1 hypothetical protein [Gemmatimonadota bacterium]